MTDCFKCGGKRYYYPVDALWPTMCHDCTVVPKCEHGTAGCTGKGDKHWCDDSAILDELGIPHLTPDEVIEGIKRAIDGNEFGGNYALLVLKKAGWSISMQRLDINNHMTYAIGLTPPDVQLSYAELKQKYEDLKGKYETQSQQLVDLKLEVEEAIAIAGEEIDKRAQHKCEWQSCALCSKATHG